MSSRFAQIHFLTSYPSALLNRDDAGFAKRIPFGGATRTRVSSQCLKRHWRNFSGEGSFEELGVPPSIRSRLTFDKFFLKPLINEEKIEPSLAQAVTEAIVSTVLGESAKAKKAKEKKEEEKSETISLQTSQITILGRPEIEFLFEQAKQICAQKPEIKNVSKAVKEHFKKEAKKNLEQLKHASGLSAALFGRMVTSDMLSRGDAAIHVAHAFTVHSEAAETDYFSAIDELLQQDEELGSGHINTTELTSGLFYGYVVVDLPLLVSNLEGCKSRDWQSNNRDLAAKVVERLLQLVATVSPGAKLGSTAPYSYAHLVLAEFGSAQPRTFANAFLRPVKERPDLLQNTYQALAKHIQDLNDTYGKKTQCQIAGLGDLSSIQTALEIKKSLSLERIGKWAATQIRGTE